MTEHRQGRTQATPEIPGLLNQRHPQAGAVVGGQPSLVQLRQAADAGVREVISLRAPNEPVGYDEAAEVKRLGLAWHSLPIPGAAGLTRAAATELDTLLAKVQAPFLLHCASGGRVGALMALRAAWQQGKSAADALALGREWGLPAKLEPVVEKLLANA